MHPVPDPTLDETRKALAFLDRPERVDDRGDPVISLDDVIRAEAIRRGVHGYLRVALAEVDRLAGELDDARDETQRLWDATEADLARAIHPLTLAYLHARAAAQGCADAPPGVTNKALAMYRACAAWEADGCRVFAGPAKKG